MTPAPAFPDDLLTHNAEIDRQHRELHGLGQRLLGSRRLLADPRGFGEGLRFLAGYVHLHFAAEERAMERHGYPALEAHRRVHRDFRLEIEEILAAVRVAGVTPALRRTLHTLLSDWLTQHLLTWDRQLAAFLAERELDDAVEAFAWEEGELVWEDLPIEG